MAASDYVPISFKNRLHLAGRPQMSSRPSAVPASMMSNARSLSLVPAAVQKLLNVLERDVVSRVARNWEVRRDRVNYLRPEQMPPHQRDFPRRELIEELPGAAGSRALALIVAWYLVAMFAGILLLGYLTASERPSTTAASAGVTLTK